MLRRILDSGWVSMSPNREKSTVGAVGSNPTGAAGAVVGALDRIFFDMTHNILAHDARAAATALDRREIDPQFARQTAHRRPGMDTGVCHLICEGSCGGRTGGQQRLGGADHRGAG